MATVIVSVSPCKSIDGSLDKIEPFGDIRSAPVNLNTALAFIVHRILRVGGVGIGIGIV